MPRDLFRLYFNERYQASREELNGELLTTVTLKVFGANAVPMLVADVRISASILSSIPVAENNNELLYAQPGTPIRLQRSASGRLEITGLNKRGIGNITQYTMPITITTGSGAHVVVNPGGTSLVSVVGFCIRTVTLGELATMTPGGFGETPLEALAIFNARGVFFGFAGAGGGVSTGHCFIPIDPASTVSGVSAISAISAVSSVSSISGGVSAVFLSVTSLGDSGAGTLRNIWDQARQLRAECVIRFDVGGTINIRENFQPLTTTDFGHIILDGRSAPSAIIIDASAISTEISTAIFQFRCPQNALLGIRASNIPNAFAIIGDGARDTVFEDITIFNNDGRGSADAAILAEGIGGDNSTTMKRIDITGAARPQGFDINAGVHAIVSSLVSSTQTGYRIGRGTATIYRSRAEDQSLHAIHLRSSATASIAQVSLNNSLIDAVKMEISGTGLTNSGQSPSANFISCTVTRAGQSGGTPQAGFRITEGSRAKIQGTVISGNYGHGIIVTSTAIVDLGGGILGSSGGNLLRGNGLASGLDVMNSMTSAQIVKAENNTWDHLTLADVSTIDVSSNVDVDPIKGAVGSGFTYYVSPTGDDAATVVSGATFKTIQRAMDVVQPGESIFVSAGTYYERVSAITDGTFNQRITLQGEVDGSNNPLAIIDGSDATSGWVTAPEVGAGVYKTTTIAYQPWHMTADDDKTVWRIANKWMDGATQDIFGGNGGYPVVNGKQVLAFTASQQVTPFGTGSALSFWDGIGALFGYTGGTTYVRFANSDTPASHAVRVSPGPASKNASPVGACVTLRNRSYITIKRFLMRGARNAVLIHGTNSSNQAGNNIIEECDLFNGIARVRFSGNAYNNTVRNNYMEMRGFTISSFLPTFANLGNAWPSRIHQRHFFNVDKFLVSGDGGEDDRCINIHSDGTGSIPLDNSITGNEMYGCAQAINSNEHNGTIFASNTCFANFSQHIYFFGPNANYRIADNLFYTGGQYQIRTNNMNQAGQVYIYRNKMFHPTSNTEHFFLGLLNGTFQDATMDIWIYHNSIAGGVAAFIHNFDAGFGPASLKIVDNIFSTNGLVFNGYPTKMGKYDYNWQYNDTVAQSWAGVNNITSSQIMWSPTSALPDFLLSATATARNAGLYLATTFTVQGTVFSPRAGMVSGYGGADNIPDMGAVQS